MLAMRARSTRHRHRHCHCHRHDRGWHGAGSLRGGCLLVEGAIDIEAEHHALRPHTLRELTLERVREGAWALGPTLGRTPSQWPQRQSITPYERGILQDIRDSFNVRFLFIHEREDCFGSPSRLSLSTQALNHIPFRFANARSNGGGGWRVEPQRRKLRGMPGATRSLRSLPRPHSPPPRFAPRWGRPPPARTRCAMRGASATPLNKRRRRWEKRHLAACAVSRRRRRHSSFLIPHSGAFRARWSALQDGAPAKPVKSRPHVSDLDHGVSDPRSRRDRPPITP